MRLSTILLSLFLLAPVMGCGAGRENAPDTREGDASTKQSGGGDDKARVLMVIAKQNFRDEELFEPRKALEERGHRVTIASSEPGACKGMLGGEAVADMALSQAQADDFDAVVFVGGSGAKAYFQDDHALGLARAAADQKKLVAAICLAPQVLANAGLLKGRRATAWSSQKQAMSEQGATWSAEPCVVDDTGGTTVITANGPDAAKAFGEAILKALEGG